MKPRNVNRLVRIARIKCGRRIGPGDTELGLYRKFRNRFLRVSPPRVSLEGGMFLMAPNASTRVTQTAIINLSSMQQGRSMCKLIVAGVVLAVAAPIGLLWSPHAQAMTMRVSHAAIINNASPIEDVAYRCQKLWRCG